MSSTSRNPALWGLMDCNNFYASCERLFRPDLVGRPIVVLSNNDGCIVARSAEAKALGIPMGEPEYKARPLLRRHNVAVFSSNYALYGDISHRVMTTAETLVPQVEVYSIDEAFLRLDATIPPLEAATALRDRVQRWVGIDVSVGLAPTRTLAKLANHLAKKGTGVFLFPQAPLQQDALLAQTPAEEIWGIGRRQAARLASRGITTALGLRDLDDAWLRKHLTVTGWRTAMELRGIPCIDENSAPTPRHTLVSSRSFGGRVTEKAQLAEALTLNITNAAERLRREKLLAGAVSVHIRTSRHAQAPFSDTVCVSLPAPEADTRLLLSAVLRGLDRLFRPGYLYAKAGVMLHDLTPLHGRQGSLLTTPEDLAQQQQSANLMAALDAVNARFGRHTLHYAHQGLDTQAPWRMRQLHCSPPMTTSWIHLPSAGRG